MEKETVMIGGIKRGSFFRLPGRRTLWQKFDSCWGQAVSGRDMGVPECFPDTPVIPVKAAIVEQA